MYWPKAHKHAHKHTFHCNVQTSCLLLRAEKPEAADSGLRMSIMGLHCSGGQSHCIYLQTRIKFPGETPQDQTQSSAHFKAGTLAFVIILEKAYVEAIIGDCFRSWSVKLHNLESANNTVLLPECLHILFETEKAKGVKCAEGQGLGKNCTSPPCLQSKLLAVCLGNQTKTFLISLCWLFSQEVFFWDKVWKTLLPVLNGAVHIPASVTNSSKMHFDWTGPLWDCYTGHLFNPTSF